MKITRVMTAGALALTAVGALAGCSHAAATTSPASASSASSAAVTPIVAVGAENEYADVISQIGGQYVTVSAIMSNPNTDPHTFEADASVARTVSKAKLIVQNGVGYDDFMAKIEASSPNPDRKVIVAQTVRGLPDSTPNPHLWYDPKTMPAVAKAIADDLSSLEPAQASFFQDQLTTFDDSLTPWTTAIAAFKKDHPNTPVAVTEPVADYMLQAAGTDIKTPWNLQAAIMNGTDPSPQDSATQEALFNDKTVKVFLYNQQVTDSVTEQYLALAKKNDIPVVGVYETMPTPGYTYQQWMLAEVKALDAAVTDGTSTTKL